MNAIEEKERLVGNVVRLRRAERAMPHSEDIAVVRADLERAIGPTVTRAMAARLLGVSQTALDRWITSGDVPAVITPLGRREVPSHALIELVEAVDEHRRADGGRHALASVLRRRRSDAERLDPRTILPDAARRGTGHRGAELRGLAYHRAISQRLDERVVEEARRRLRRWLAAGRIDPRYAARWEAVLAQPPARIADLIGDDTPSARELRQSSPFAGTLTEQERRRVLELTRWHAP